MMTTQAAVLWESGTDWKVEDITLDEPRQGEVLCQQLSDDIDPHTDELWGNFPRTDSQTGLISSALSRSWEEGLWHAS